MAEYRVTFLRAGVTIPVWDDEVVLDVARDCGLSVLFGCAFGECGTCKVRLVKGRVAPYGACAISDEEKAGGFLLLCRARPRSDLVIEE